MKPLVKRNLHMISLKTICLQRAVRLRPLKHIGLCHVFTSFCTAAMFMAPFVLREATLKESN